jgi:hypothetical protein
MTANPADDRARSRDLARLRDLTTPHLPYPGRAHQPGARPHDSSRPRRGRQIAT